MLGFFLLWCRAILLRVIVLRCSYARENSTVVVRGATLVDNVADTGPVVLVVTSSNLRTYQVILLSSTRWLAHWHPTLLARF